MLEGDPPMPKYVAYIIKIKMIICKCWIISENRFRVIFGTNKSLSLDTVTLPPRNIRGVEYQIDLFMYSAEWSSWDKIK